MYRFLPPQRSASAVFAILCFTNGVASPQQHSGENAGFPFPEKLSYRIEWRLVTAGSAMVEMSRGTPLDWETSLNLESAGLVSRLYRVSDKYRVTSNDRFCPSHSVLDAQEGKRHTLSRLTFDNTRHKVDYDERDLLKNSSLKRQLDIAPCTYDIVGALESLREMNLRPDKWATLPVTNGKKMAYVKVQGQAKESLRLAGKTYETIRYEVFLFDDVLYKRKGRLLMWVSDDSDRVPIQLRLQMGFPIGTITVQLEKAQKI